MSGLNVYRQYHLNKEKQLCLFWLFSRFCIHLSHEPSKSRMITLANCQIHLLVKSTSISYYSATTEQVRLIIWSLIISK